MLSSSMLKSLVDLIDLRGVVVAPAFFPAAKTDKNASSRYKSVCLPMEKFFAHTKALLPARAFWKVYVDIPITAEQYRS